MRRSRNNVVGFDAPVGKFGKPLRRYAILDNTRECCKLLVQSCQLSVSQRVVNVRMRPTNLLLRPCAAVKVMFFPHALDDAVCAHVYV